MLRTPRFAQPGTDLGAARRLIGTRCSPGIGEERHELARTRGDGTLVYPFTLVFASHMAIFGLSRLAHADRRRTLATLTLIAVSRAWLLIFLPFLIVQGVSGSSLALSLWAVACIYVAAAVFTRTEPDIRNTSLTLSRWIRQAVSGGLGSTAGWLVLAALDRVP